MRVGGKHIIIYFNKETLRNYFQKNNYLHSDQIQAQYVLILLETIQELYTI